MADELLTHLAPWIRDKRVNLWDDSQILAGSKWKDAIDAAIDEAAVAVLLVSKAFFASDFTADYELPQLMARSSRNEIRLVWVAVGYSAVRSTTLPQFQAANNPDRPLESLSGAQRNKVMVDVATTVADAASMRSLAGGLRMMEETTEPLEAALAQRPQNAPDATAFKPLTRCLQTGSLFQARLRQSPPQISTACHHLIESSSLIWRTPWIATTNGGPPYASS